MCESVFRVVTLHSQGSRLNQSRKTKGRKRRKTKGERTHFPNVTRKLWYSLPLIANRKSHAAHYQFSEDEVLSCGLMTLSLSASLVTAAAAFSILIENFLKSKNNYHISFIKYKRNPYFKLLVWLNLLENEKSIYQRHLNVCHCLCQISTKVKRLDILKSQ